MADDLALLQQQLGVFQDEEEMRIDVAARVVAQSSRAAFEDEERLKKSWNELEKAEHVVNELQLELNEAQLAAAQESSGLLGDAQQSKSVDPTTSSTRRVSDIRFQLHSAERALQRADAALRQTQKEVDRRQAARLAEAKQLEREEAEAEHASVVTRPAAHPKAADAAAAVRVKRATGRPVPLASSASTALPCTNTSVNGGTLAGGSRAVPSPIVTTTRVLYRVPNHLKGITHSDYSGGAVLPSLGRVQVTRADIRSKQRRYQDDSEMVHYVERITKRQRLEAVANHQRRLAAVSNRVDTPSQTLSVSIAEPAEAQVKTEGERDSQVHQVKQEPGVGDAAGGATSAAAGAPKTLVATKEAEVGEYGCRLPEARVKVETDSQKVVNEVIDVDALMEDDDDAAVAAVVTRVSTQLTDSYTHCSRTATSFMSQNSQQQQQRQRGRTGSVSSTAISESEEFVLEMEEVTLLPQARMDAAIYNRLLDYQQEGLLWLLALHSRRSGGILGDEMGLGKTIQVAAMINALHHSCMLHGPVLIVAPMTVLRQWLAELHRWAPYVRSCVMHESSGSDVTREWLLQSVQGTPAVIITTYAAMRIHLGLLLRTGFQYVILDEGHKVSNPEAGATLAAKSFTTPHRLILSGSPIQNSLKELWCLFDFVRPGLLGTMSRFIDEFETPIAQSRNACASPLSQATAVECAKALQAHIAPYLLRRLKRQVNTSLPPKYERVLRVPLTDEQLDQYLQVLFSPVVQRLFAQMGMCGSPNGGLDRDGRDCTGSLHVAGPRVNMASRRYNSSLRLASFRLMNQLRQICNHADIYAVQQGADEEDRMMLGRHGAATKSSSASATRSGQHRSFRSNNPVNLLGSGKLNALLMMLKEWQLFGHRVLIFSQTRMMLDIIENMCEQHAYRYIRMDGETNGHHRQELMDRFNEDDSIFVALLTTRVGGIGVNLIGADRVVIFDPDWNPITDVQARERAWRIGQKREVCVYRLITSGSVEEAILRRQLAKMYVTDKVLKDPELQRFFHRQDNFMESLLLGSEYESRVPVDKRYLLTAHHLHSASAGGRGGARSRDGHAAPWEYGNAVPGVDSDGSEDGIDIAESGSGNDAGSTEKQLKKERTFGILVPIKDGGGSDEVGTGRDDTRKTDGDDDDLVGILGVGNENKKTNKKVCCETQMLQDLIDRQDVSVAGHDRVAHRLARKKAEDMMRRVSSSGALTTEAMQEQQRQYSLLHAIGEKKAKEATDREEKGRYYREEMAAARKRRHE